MAMRFTDSTILFLALYDVIAEGIKDDGLLLFTGEGKLVAKLKLNYLTGISEGTADATGEIKFSVSDLGVFHTPFDSPAHIGDRLRLYTHDWGMHD